MPAASAMEVRPLGKTGLRVSELGICLPDDPTRAAEIARRAADAGVRFFRESLDGSALENLPGPVRQSCEVLTVVNGRPRIGSYGSCVWLEPRELAPGDPLPPNPTVILCRYNVLQQEATQTLFPAAYRAGHGIVATHVLGGGALAGRLGHTPPGAAVAALRPLVKPRRTLAQLAIQAVLANEYVSCAVVRVSTVEHLSEALGALEAEPLTISDLEHIFETYANRYDRK
jgi:aryl-alcohol dehydrogenase-like predicted oxidoreductase